MIVGGQTAFPDTWTWNKEAMNNLSIHNLQKNSEEYRFVSAKFHETLPSNQIVKIERIQNRRKYQHEKFSHKMFDSLTGWYRQYEAHRDDFTERHGKSTEQWLFHGKQSIDFFDRVDDCS